MSQPRRIDGLSRIVDLTACRASSDMPTLCALRDGGTVWLMPGEVVGARMVPCQMLGLGRVRSMGVLDNNESTGRNDCRLRALREDGSLCTCAEPARVQSLDIVSTVPSRCGWKACRRPDTYEDRMAESALNIQGSQGHRGPTPLKIGARVAPSSPTPSAPGAGRRQPRGR